MGLGIVLSLGNDGGVLCENGISGGLLIGLFMEIFSLVVVDGVDGVVCFCLLWCVVLWIS